MGTVITIVILTTLVQTVYKHLSKLKYEAKEDPPNAHVAALMLKSD